jgi:hypothetical protein
MFALAIVEDPMPKDPRPPLPVTVPRMPRLPRVEEPATTPDPVEASLAGIASGMAKILAKQDETNRGIGQLQEQVDVLQSRVIVHGADIGEIRADIVDLKSTAADHSRRLLYAERGAPRGASLPPLHDVAKEVRGEEAARKELPSGTWIVDPIDGEKWMKARENQLKSQRWDALLGGIWKITVTAVGAAVFVVLCLLARSLVTQAQHDGAAVTAPH